MQSLAEHEDYLTTAASEATKWCKALAEGFAIEEKVQKGIEGQIVKDAPYGKETFDKLQKIESELYAQVERYSQNSAELQTHKDRLQSNLIVEESDFNTRKAVRSVYRTIYGIAQPADPNKDVREAKPINVGSHKITERAKAFYRNARNLGAIQPRAVISDTDAMNKWLNNPANYWINAALTETGLIGSTEGRAKVYTEDMASFLLDYLLDARKPSEIDKTKVDARKPSEIDKTKVKLILDFYTYRAAIQIATKGKFEGFFNMYWAASGAIGEDAISISSGVHILEAILRYTQMEGDTRYVKLADLIVDYLESLRDTRPGYSGLFKNAWTKKKVTEGDARGEVGKLTYDHLNAIRVLNDYKKLISPFSDEPRLGELKTYYDSHKEYYDKRFREVAGPLFDSVNSWINKSELFDAEGGYFYAGYDDEGNLDKGIYVPAQVAAYEWFGEKKFSCIKAVVQHGLIRKSVRKYDPPISTNPAYRDFVRWWHTYTETGFGSGVHAKDGKLEDASGPISREITAQVAYILAQHSKVANNNKGDNSYEGLRKILTDNLKKAVINSALSEGARGLPALSEGGKDFFGSYHQAEATRLISLAATVNLHRLLTMQPEPSADAAQAKEWQAKLE
ncbi:MAG: hypothetical protein NT060_00090, partial [Candidatus Omnitrophica bacterium]|nr:hypothetical protein [Candidatus Omnitrophota bacterium]